MKFYGSINKRMMIVFLSIVVLFLAFTFINNAYAGKPAISLNSPASFPVDI